MLRIKLVSICYLTTTQIYPTLQQVGNHWLKFPTVLFKKAVTVKYYRPMNISESAIIMYNIKLVTGILKLLLIC